MSIKCICLKTKGKIVEFSLPKNFNIEEFNIDSLPKEVTDIIGQGNLEREVDFDYKDTTISLYAWIEGKAGKENKHELPPPVDNELYFGNIYLFKHVDSKLINFTKKEYDEFYDNSFGGFEDIGSEDSEYSEDDPDDTGEDLKDFIVDDRKPLVYTSRSGREYTWDDTNADSDPDYHPGDSQDEIQEENENSEYDDDSNSNSCQECSLDIEECSCDRCHMCSHLLDECECECETCLEALEDCQCSK